MPNGDGVEEIEEEINDIDDEIEEDLDEAEEDADSVIGKKERIQMINHDIKKLLQERDELERQVLDLEDDIDEKRI